MSALVDSTFFDGWKQDAWSRSGLDDTFIPQIVEIGLTIGREVGLAYASGGVSLLGRVGSTALRAGLFAREAYEGATNAYAGSQALADGKPLTAAYHYGLTVLNLFGIKNAKGGLDDAAEMVSNIRFLKPRVVDQAADDVARRIEAEAAQALEQLQRVSHPRAHFYSRHGAHTTLEQQHKRATYGIRPDGGMDYRLNDSGRFLSHHQQLEAVNAAMEYFRRTGENAFSFDMGDIIGEGFTRLADDLVYTSNVTAVFKDGLLLTLFPKLSIL